MIKCEECGTEFKTFMNLRKHRTWFNHASLKHRIKMKTKIKRGVIVLDHVDMGEVGKGYSKVTFIERRANGPKS